MATLVTVGAATLSTVTPSAWPRADALLASAWTEDSTLLTSSVAMVATTCTLAAVTSRRTSLTPTPDPTAAASLERKACWSRASTVPATTRESRTARRETAPGARGGGDGGGTHGGGGGACGTSSGRAGG